MMFHPIIFIFSNISKILKTKVGLFFLLSSSLAYGAVDYTSYVGFGFTQHNQNYVPDFGDHLLPTTIGQIDFIAGTKLNKLGVEITVTPKTNEVRRNILAPFDPRLGIQPDPSVLNYIEYETSLSKKSYGFTLNYYFFELPTLGLYPYAGLGADYMSLSFKNAPNRYGLNQNVEHTVTESMKQRLTYNFECEKWIPHINLGLQWRLNEHAQISINGIYSYTSRFKHVDALESAQKKYQLRFDNASQIRTSIQFMV